MIGKLHITTLLGPRDSAGSSLATVGCGVGENQPACTGRPGSDTSIACKPPECHESKTIVRVGVGLWEEYEVNSFSAGAGEYAVVFCRILYSPSTCGRRGWAMFQVRTQPHGQPKDGAVNVPYTSSMVMANGRPGSGTAEWLSAQPAGVWPAQCGPVPHVGNGTVVSRSSLSDSTVPAGTSPLATLLVSPTPHRLEPSVRLPTYTYRSYTASAAFIPRPNSGFAPTSVKFFVVDRGPPPAPTPTSACAAVGVARTRARTPSPATSFRFIATSCDREQAL